MKTVLLAIALLVGFGTHSQIQAHTATQEQNANKLAILWTSGDPDVAIKMVMMYAYNMKKAKQWDEMTFIIWGPSSKLAANYEPIQEYLKKMKAEGIKIEACQACADSYGVSDKLREQGIDVKFMGVPLTNYIKQGWKTMTF